MKSALPYPVSFPVFQIYWLLLNIYCQECLALWLAFSGGSEMGLYSLPFLSRYKYSLYQSGPWEETEYMLTMDFDENYQRDYLKEYE